MIPIDETGWRWKWEETRLTIGIFFSDLGDEESAHARAGATAEWMGELEALETVARLGLFSDDIQDRVDELGPFGIVSFGPIVARTRLTYRTSERCILVMCCRVIDNVPKTKLSGRKSCPKGPLRTESIVPGSRSTRTARGTYLPPRQIDRTVCVELERVIVSRFTGCFVVVDVDAFEL